MVLRHRVLKADDFTTDWVDAGLLSEPIPTPALCPPFLPRSSTHTQLHMGLFKLSEFTEDAELSTEEYVFSIPSWPQRSSGSFAYSFLKNMLQTMTVLIWKICNQIILLKENPHAVRFCIITINHKPVFICMSIWVFFYNNALRSLPVRYTLQLPENLSGSPWILETTD